MTNAKPVAKRAHYDVLDGLRGVMVLVLVACHLSAAVMHPLFPHGALAVDFCFVLSGFVAAHAYDRRLEHGELGFGGFALRRMIRTGPMAIAAMLVTGALTALGHGLAWGDGFALDRPLWALLLLYVVDAVYGLLIWRLTLRWIVLLLVPAMVALIALAMIRGGIATGSGGGIGLSRAACAFLLGVALRYKLGDLTHLRMSLWGLAILLVGAMAVPVQAGWTNALFELACVIGLFPLTVLMGAHARMSGASLALSRWLGRLAYPLALMHYPFALWLATAVREGRVMPGAAPALALALFVGVLLLGWALLRLWDRPLRQWLTGRLLHDTP